VGLLCLIVQFDTAFFIWIIFNYFLMNGYRAKLLMERKLSEKDDRSASHTADFEMNFPITILFCKKLEMPGPGNWNLGGKWMLIVRLICEERSFD
jgi:hypothetical protein